MTTLTRDNKYVIKKMRLKCCRKKGCVDKGLCGRPLRWYASFQINGKFIGHSLDAYEHEEMKALRNLCTLYFSEIEKKTKGI